MPQTGLISPLDSFSQGFDFVTGLADHQANRRAGGLIASGDLTGAAAILGDRGNMDGVLALQSEGEKRRLTAEAERMREIKDRAMWLGHAADSLGQIKDPTQRAPAFAKLIAPTMKAMGVNDEVIGQLAQSDFSDETIASFKALLGSELSKFEKVGNSIVEITPTGKVEERFTAPQENKVVGNALVSPEGDPLYVAPELRTVGPEQKLVEVAGSSPTARPGASGAAGGGNLPRGLRNNNPGNIEDGEFAKSQPGYIGSDGRFAKFETKEQGEAAQGALLASYGARGFDTPREIINRWAPPSDNNPTDAYVAFVAKELGVGPDDTLNLAKPEVAQRVAAAISKFENGPQSASNRGPIDAGGIRILAQGGPKEKTAPSGYEYKPDGTLDYIRGGPADPAVSAGPKNLRPIPPAAVNGMVTNRRELSKIDNVIAAIRENKDALGLANLTPDMIRQRTDPGGVKVRALVADIGSAKIHERSGAAVTAAEQPRLKPFVPQATDRWDVAISKLENFKAELESIIEDTEVSYGPESGYRPLSFSTTTSADRATAPAPTPAPAKAPAPNPSGPQWTAAQRAAFERIKPDTSKPVGHERRPYAPRNMAEFRSIPPNAWVVDDDGSVFQKKP